MLRTLFHIPNEIGGLPVFGSGLLLAAWGLFGVVLLIWLARRQGFNADTWGYVPLLLLIAGAIWLVLPKLCDAHGLPIRGYGAMLLAAVVSAVALAAWRAQRVGVDVDLIYTLAFWAILPGFLGARVYYIVTKWPRDFAPVYAEHGLGALLGALVNIAQGGIVFYGSLIGGVLGLGVFLYKYKMPVLGTLDLLTPSLMLGLALGRLGCLLNGCCYGGPCDLPWAVSFPAGSPPHVAQFQQGKAFFYGLKLGGEPPGPPVITEVQPDSPAYGQKLKPGEKILSVAGRPVETIEQALWLFLWAYENDGEIAITVEGDDAVRQAVLAGRPGRSEPVHPTQLYSAINAMLICLFLLACSPLYRRDGQLWATMLTIYPITRFLIEMIRTDEPISATGLKGAQNLSLLLLGFAIATWVYTLRKPPGRAFGQGRSEAAGRGDSA